MPSRYVRYHLETQLVRLQPKLRTKHNLRKKLPFTYDTISLLYLPRLLLLICSRQSLLCVFAKLYSHVCLFVTPWTGAHQATVKSMGLCRQEYWNKLPFPPPGNLPDLAIEPMSSESPQYQADSLPLYHLGSLDKALHACMLNRFGPI